MSSCEHIHLHGRFKQTLKIYVSILFCPVAVDRSGSSGSEVMDEKPVPLPRRPRQDSDVRIRYSILQRPSLPECLVLGFQVRSPPLCWGDELYGFEAGGATKRGAATAGFACIQQCHRTNMLLHILPCGVMQRIA